MSNIPKMGHLPTPVSGLPTSVGSADQLAYRD